MLGWIITAWHLGMVAIAPPCEECWPIQQHGRMLYTQGHYRARAENTSSVTKFGKYDLVSRRRPSPQLSSRKVTINVRCVEFLVPKLLQIQVIWNSTIRPLAFDDLAMLAVESCKTKKLSTKQTFAVSLDLAHSKSSSLLYYLVAFHATPG